MNHAPASRPQLFGFAGQMGVLALAGGAPAMLAANFWVWQQTWLIYPKLLLCLLLSLAWLGAARTIYKRAEFHLQTIGNLVEGIAGGDYSHRLRRAGPDDLLGLQINQLVDGLHRQRLQAKEAMSLVNSVMQGIDVAIFAFDAQGHLQLANPCALSLLGQPGSAVIGRLAADLGLAELLNADTGQLSQHVFPGAAGLWQLRRQHYAVESAAESAVEGREHTLLFVTDLKQVLRGEEMQAWRRLLRVLSHEVNNSLVPISSLSDTLRKSLASIHSKQVDANNEEELADLDEGLSLIRERAIHLAEFVRRYAQLARLPEPHKRVFDLAGLLRRLPTMLPQAQLQLSLEAQDSPAGEAQQVTLLPPELEIPFFGDPVQIEQLLINLLKNGIEADGAPLELRCHLQPLRLTVLDEGTGLANPDNLFVPFYSTKPDGGGIGLLLSRQIAEAHQGSLILQARGTARGCAAILSFGNTHQAALAGQQASD